jgi:hypothetical protein
MPQVAGGTENSANTDFDAALAQASEADALVSAMLAKHPHRMNPSMLWRSAKSMFAQQGQCNGVSETKSRGEGMKNNLFSRRFHIKSIALCLLVTFAAAAQTTAPAHPVTDAEKIADALRAGPKFITKNATILDWPVTKDGEYRVLRKGSNEWTCLPGVPGYSHDEPGCFDPVFMQWIKDSLAGRDPHITSVGISYMYVGAWVPNKWGNPNTPKGEEFHVGQHIMIVSPHENQQELQSLSHDGSNGMPYVAHLPSGTDLYLVMPCRQWDEK